MPTGPHAGLRNILQSLFEGMDAFATSAATGGREGGVQEIQQLKAQRQDMALKQQANATASANITHLQALTNATIAQTEILKMNAPLEHQKLINENQAALYDLYVNKLHVNPLFAVPIVQGQTTDTHLAGVNAKANGDLVNNTVIPGNGDRSTSGFAVDALHKVDVPIDQAEGVLQTIQDHIDYAKAVLPNGEKDPAIQSAQGRLDQMKKGATVNGYDFFVFDNHVTNSLVKRAENYRGITEFQKQQADLKEAQNKAANSALPKNSDDAQSRLTAAAQAYRANPTEDTKQALLNANEQLKNLRTLEVGKQYSDAMAKVQAQRALDDKDLDAIAQGVGSDPNSLTQLNDIASLKGSERLRLFAKIKQINPQFDPGVVKNKVKFLGEFTDPNGKTAMGIDAANTFFQHGANLLDLTKSYRTSDIKLLNTPINKLADAFGDAKYTDYSTALGVVRSEYTNAIKAGFAPQVEDSKEGRDIMSDSSTPAQVEAAVKRMGHNVLARVDSKGESFKTNMGSAYPNLITPAGAEAASKIRLNVSKYRSGGQIGKPGSGGPASSPAPAGATMKVPGSDGKMHWSDGKQDLGVVQ